MGCCESSPQPQQQLANLWDDDTDTVDGTALLQALPQAERAAKLAKWMELGGDLLEEPLRAGWVKLVRASWLVKLSKAGGKLRRRQDLPRKAFISLDELKAAGPFHSDEEDWNWTSFRIIVVSYPWLQPGHPDPHGENLRVVAQALKAYEDEGGPYGVLIDFAALYQAERTTEEYAAFKLALGALHLFYSHEHTVVFKVTKFPPQYPNNPSFEYVLPVGANTVEYMQRGWCFTESAVGGLVKSSEKVVDLGRFGSWMDMFSIIHDCSAGRAPPLHPEDFDTALGEKMFTNKKDDFDKVASLYSAAFYRLLGSARRLDYGGLQWGPNEVRQLVKALRSNSTLRELDLSKNKMGIEGAVALAQALRVNSTLQTLNLMVNQMGPQGAAALAEALHVNNTIQTLNLASNKMGWEGTAALAKAVLVNKTLRTLHLEGNTVGPEGAAALAKALRGNHTLKELNLSHNDIGNQGAAALGEALRVNNTLHTMDLAFNEVGPEGAAALAEALRENHSLATLCLYANDISGQYKTALQEACRNKAQFELVLDDD